MMHDQFLSTMQREPSVHGAAEHLRGRIRGTVIQPGDAEYEQARRVWNSRVDRSPKSVVRPRDEADVAQAVLAARDAGLPVAVRSGGHSLAGYGTIQDGVVIDLSQMTKIEIDPRERVASVQPGATWGDYSRQAHGYGLATPSGDSASVGVGGLTLGGGIGWLVRKHGLTVDSLLSADVVTADGQCLTAGTESHPDLFWALRGGGGNFGVVTSLQFRLHPVGMVFGGAILYPAEAGVWRALVGAATEAPDELTIMAYALPAPPFPFLPTKAHGTPATMILACFAGDPGVGQQALAPFLELGGHRPWGEMLGEMPYPDLYNLTAVGAISRPHALRAGFMQALDDDTIDTILAYGRRPSGPMSIAQLRVLGGELARVPAGATAFTHRDKPLFLSVMNVWEPGDPEEAHVAWVDSLWRAVASRTDGTYLNFLDDEGEERVRAAFTPEAFTRLVEVKRRYDPDNLFRHNANIRPV